MIGRSNDVAWGATYTFADAIDSWIERCAEGKYFREPDRWHEFRRRVETILRKRKPPVEVVFYENEHGLLDGDPHTEGLYLATRWAAAQCGVGSLGPFLRMWDVRHAEQAMQVLGQVESSWNFVVADRHGNIGYQMSGLLPKRKPGHIGFVPQPGWRQEFDWDGFLSYVDLPHVMNPESGFLATANNDLNALGQTQPINMSMGPYRAERIAEVLSNNDSLTIEDMRSLQFDLVSTQAARFMELLRPILPDTRQGRILRGWDLTYTPGSQGASCLKTSTRRSFARSSATAQWVFKWLNTSCNRPVY